MFELKESGDTNEIEGCKLTESLRQVIKYNRVDLIQDAVRSVSGVGVTLT